MSVTLVVFIIAFVATLAAFMFITTHSGGWWTMRRSIGTTCPVCNGLGSTDESEICPRCNGRRYIWEPRK